MKCNGDCLGCEIRILYYESGEYCEGRDLECEGELEEEE